MQWALFEQAPGQAQAYLCPGLQTCSPGSYGWFVQHAAYCCSRRRPLNGLSCCLTEQPMRAPQRCLLPPARRSPRSGQRRSSCCSSRGPSRGRRGAAGSTGSPSAWNASSAGPTRQGPAGSAVVVWVLRWGWLGNVHQPQGAGGYCCAILLSDALPVFVQGCWLTVGVRGGDYANV